MLTYSLDNRKGMSLYDYIYTCIKDDILNGRITANDRLPSKRSFAKNLGVSVITIENAYSQLLAEGFIYAVEKRGYFAADISENTEHIRYRETQNDVQSDMQNDLHECEKPDLGAEGNTSAQTQLIVDFANNAVNTEKFPFSQWSKIMRNVLSAADDRLLRSAPVKGIYELREAIAGYLYNFRGLNVSPEQIVIGSGTEYMYGILIQLLGHDKVFAMEDPGYVKVSKILEGNCVAYHRIPIDSAGMEFRGLEKTDANIVHLTPSHHFPSGTVMPIQRRMEFINWAMKADDRFIIEDDYDCEFRLQGKPIGTMFERDMNGKVIYMNTFSKTLAPSFRISYMVLPVKLLRIYEEKLGYMSCTVPNIEQFTLAKFMSEGYFERHINRMRVYYRSQRNEILDAIHNSSLNGKCQILEEHAGLHFLLKINTEISDEELVKCALEKGMRITCLNDYSVYRRRENEHILILNYSGIRFEEITESINMLADVVAFLK